MRTKLLFLALLMSTSVMGQWKSLYRGTDSLNRFLNASFYSLSEGFVVSDLWVGFTADSGRTFQHKFIENNNVDYNKNPVNLTFGFYYADVKAFGNNKLLVAGEYANEPAILQSTNNGNTWKVVYHFPYTFNSSRENYVSRMEFPVNNDIGYVVFSDGIVKTTNGGNTWTQSRNMAMVGRQLTVMDFANNLVGYVAGEQSLLKTTDGGTNWSLLNAPFQVKAISAVNNNLVYVLSTNNNIYYSNNGGASWILTNRPITHLDADNIYFVNDSVGYTAYGYVYQTRNRGKSWERLPADRDPEVGQLIPYNADVMWACGDGERLAMTTNRGGKPIPRAYVDYDVSQVCGTGQLPLISQSNTSYQHHWYLNNRSIARTYNTIVPQGVQDTIKLVVSDGIQKDSMIRIVDYEGYFTIKLESISLQDTICSGVRPQFTILKSQPGVSYVVNGIAPVFGTGSDLTLAGYAGADPSATLPFTVYAATDNQCGRQSKQQIHLIHVINSVPGIDVINGDTVCMDKVFYIRVQNTRKTYEYWADAGLPKVKGTGGTILIPCRTPFLKQLRSTGLTGPAVNFVSFYVFVRHEKFHCEDGIGHRITCYARRSGAQFQVLGMENFKGDTLRLLNQSEQSRSYFWTFDRGASYERNDTRVPIGLRYNRQGIRKITLYAYTKEGCVDSLTRNLEVFTKIGETPSGTVCNAESGQVHVDSFLVNKYFDNRTIYEDEYGSRILAGTFRDPSHIIRYLYPESGWYALKYNKAGKLMWKLEYPGFDYAENYSIEQAIGDSKGNTYLLGYGQGNVLFSGYAPRLGTPRPGPGAFIAKVSPSGELLWVKHFYNQFFSAHLNTNMCRGSMLRGKNDDFYYITQRKPGYDFFIDNTLVVDYAEKQEGIIIHFNNAGQVLRKKPFPSLYASFELGNVPFPVPTSYTFNPTAVWSSHGTMAIYTQIDTTAKSSDLDGLSLPVDVHQVNTHLFFLDTISLKLQSIKPVYKLLQNQKISVNPDAFTVDEFGNYYISYTQLNYFHRSKPNYELDTLKAKTYVAAFDEQGEMTWVKKMEGLQVSNLFAEKGRLKLAGLNFHIYSGASFQYLPNHSTAYENTKKLTFFSDTASFSGKGKYGLGSIDAIVATLNAENGDLLDLTHLGTPKMEATMTMAKGYGSQIWVSSTVGTNVYAPSEAENTYSVLKTFKLPISNNCSSSYLIPEALPLAPATLPKNNLSLPAGSINAFPNPVQDQLTLSTIGHNSNIQSITVIDRLGRKIWTKTGLDAGQFQLDTRAFPKGQVYVVEVQMAEGFVRVRVVKQ